MALETDGIIYKSVPAHLIQYEDGAIIKRGTLETYVRGEGALEVLQRILAEAAGGATLDELRADFAPEDQPAIDYILQHLIERRLLIPVQDAEGPKDGRETP